MEVGQDHISGTFGTFGTSVIEGAFIRGRLATLEVKIGTDVLASRTLSETYLEVSETIRVTGNGGAGNTYLNDYDITFAVPSNRACSISLLDLRSRIAALNIQEGAWVTLSQQYTWDSTGDIGDQYTVSSSGGGWTDAWSWALTGPAEALAGADTIASGGGSSTNWPSSRIYQYGGMGATRSMASEEWLNARQLVTEGYDAETSTANVAAPFAGKISIPTVNYVGGSSPLPTIGWNGLTFAPNGSVQHYPGQTDLVLLRTIKSLGGGHMSHLTGGDLQELTGGPLVDNIGVI
jgi:hypothetical protein